MRLESACVFRVPADSNGNGGSESSGYNKRSSVLAKFTVPGTTFWRLFFYNALSFALCAQQTKPELLSLPRNKPQNLIGLLLLSQGISYSEEYLRTINFPVDLRSLELNDMSTLVEESAVPPQRRSIVCGTMMVFAALRTADG